MAGSSFVKGGKLSDPGRERQYRRMVSIWIDDNTIERVEKVAWRLHDSRSHMIARVLEEHISDYEKEEPSEQTEETPDED